MRFSRRLSLPTIVLICFLELLVPDGIEALQVYAGETAKLRYTRKLRESRVDFGGWRVTKNGEVIGGLGKEPGSAYQCTDALLRQFCLTKTEFLKLEETLLLRIRNTSVNDSGNYTVEWVFNSLESNDKEEIQLVVIKGSDSTVQCSQSVNGSTEEPTTAKLSPAVASASTMRPILFFLFRKMRLSLLFL